MTWVMRISEVEVEGEVEVNSSGWFAAEEKAG
jgi:hypothetical protein